MSASTTARDIDEDALFREYQKTGERKVRNTIVESYLGLAYHIADSYAEKGVPRDDLRQIATVGLVKAVSRFDPDHGAAFSSFAGPHIRGELRHYFRDSTWSVRVPRSVKELSGQVRRARPELEQDLGRPPTADDLAKYLKVTREEILEALDAATAHRTTTLETQFSDGSTSVRVGAVDPNLERFERGLLADELLELLDERSKQILVRRFRDEWTQQQIADELGISQMHVSRLIRRALAQLQDEAIDRGMIDA